MAEKSTLVLSSSMLPHSIVSWQQAITMVYLGKAGIIEVYPGEEIRSPTATYDMPSVIRLSRSMPKRPAVVRFSRYHVLLRDKFTCQYCSQCLPPSKLNYDHVVPRHKGGKTTWENVVSSCYPCNSFKANRTPAEAGMTLSTVPRRPTHLNGVDLPPGSVVPEVWTHFGVRCHNHGTHN